MAGSSNTDLFVVLVCFWTLLTMFSYTFDEVLLVGDIEDLVPGESSQRVDLSSGFREFMSDAFGLASNIPIVNVFVPMVKMLTFQYPDVPNLFVIFLNLIMVLTGRVMYVMIRGES